MIESKFIVRFILDTEEAARLAASSIPENAIGLFFAVAFYTVQPKQIQYNSFAGPLQTGERGLINALGSKRFAAQASGITADAVLDYCNSHELCRTVAIYLHVSPAQGESARNLLIV